MSYEIKKAAVLGQRHGRYHCRPSDQRGIPCCLLDIVPLNSRGRQEAGLTEKNPAWRNRFAANGLAGVTKSSRRVSTARKNASMIKIGNFEDNLNCCRWDWVIEVVIENLKIKQELFAKVEKIVRPDCIVTTTPPVCPSRTSPRSPAQKSRSTSWAPISSIRPGT